MQKDDLLIRVKLEQVVLLRTIPVIIGMKVSNVLHWVLKRNLKGSENLSVHLATNSRMKVHG